MKWPTPPFGRSGLRLYPFDCWYGVRLHGLLEPISIPVVCCNLGEGNERLPRCTSHLPDGKTSCLYDRHRNEDPRTAASSIQTARRPVAVQYVSLNAASTESEHETPQEIKPLSKNAQKRLLKKERFEANKAQRRALEKAQRLEDKEKKRKEWEGKLAAMSSQEQDLALKEKLQKKIARKEKAFDRKRKMKQAMESTRNLVIDLEFCDCMKPNELDSLVKQVMYAYAANSKAQVPTRLSLTGYTGEIANHLSKASGFGNWMIHKHEQSYLEVFRERRSDLVYLTADSEYLIEQLEESKIYIVGGIVDRNRQKGLTLKKAESQGIATAKFPISEFLKTTGTMVLTVNQVVEICIHYLELQNWDGAFRRVIPFRKRLNGDDADEPQ